MSATTGSPKHEARAVIDALPDDVTLPQILAALDAILLRQKLEMSLASGRAGRVISNEEVWRKRGMEP